MSRIAVGTGPLGSAPAQYGYEVTADVAVATIERAFRGPLDFVDTAHSYGGGASESRIGAAIAASGGLPASVTLATKVGVEVPIRTSFLQSLERLGLDRVSLVYLHDPEKIPFPAGIAPGGPLRELVALRDAGLIGHLGVAGGPVDLLTGYLRTGEFEVVLSHNRYSLVDTSAEPLIAFARDHGIGFVNAAPYGGGMLVRGPDAIQTYRYEPASSAVIERVRRIQSILEPHGIPLAAAALQFSLRNPGIASTIVGMSSPERIDQTIELATLRIPEAVWAEVQR